MEVRRLWKRRNSCQATYRLLGRADGVEQVGKGFKVCFSGNRLTILLLNSRLRQSHLG